MHHDRFKVEANSSITELLISGFPFSPLTFNVSDSLGRIADARLVNGSLALLFNPPLEPGEIVVLNVTAIYFGDFRFSSQDGSPKASLSIPPPLAEHLNLTGFFIRVEKMPSLSWTGETTTSVDWTGMGEQFLSYYANNTRYIPRLFNITFRGNFIVAECLSVYKKVKIGWDGLPVIESRYKIRSLVNGTEVKSLDLEVPENVTDIDARDDLGKLRPLDLKKAYSVAQVQLRYPPGYGEYASFTLIYRPQVQSSIFSLSSYRRVRVPLTLEFPSYLGVFRVDVEVPEGGVIREVKVEGLNSSITALTGGKASLLVYRYNPLDQGYLELTFEYTPLLTVAKWATPIVAVAVFLLVYLKFRGKVEVEEVKPEEAPPKLLSLVEDLTRSYEELFSLEDRFDREVREASRRRSATRLRSARSRYSKEVDRVKQRISKLKKDIVEAKPEVKDLVDRLKDLDSEASLLREQVDLARSRFMRKAIGKSLYERAERDYRRKLSSVRGRIGRILEDLRTEVS